MVDICARCKKELSEDDKKTELPICIKCVKELTTNIIDKIKNTEIKKAEKNVENFSRFIVSSGQLFKLDDMETIQCCFNVFMSETTRLEDEKIDIAEKVFTDAIEFIKREIERINKERQKEKFDDQKSEEKSEEKSENVDIKAPKKIKVE